LLSSVAGDDPFAGLLPARKAEMSRRRQPVRQNRKSLPARPADPAPYPHALVLVVVRVAEPPAVANDREILAKRAQSRQELQRHYPGSMLSFVFGSAIKRITAGVKARR
jgi:hypothetical protein